MANVLFSVIWYQTIYITDIAIQHGWLGHKEKGLTVLIGVDNIESSWHCGEIDFGLKPQNPMNSSSAFPP